jgi:hypothetical protein
MRNGSETPFLRLLGEIVAHDVREEEVRSRTEYRDAQV